MKRIILKLLIIASVVTVIALVLTKQRHARLREFKTLTDKLIVEAIEFGYHAKQNNIPLNEATREWRADNE